MSLLLGISRTSRNKAVESIKHTTEATSERVHSGLKQFTNESQSHVRLKTPHKTFKLEASFEARGTVYPQIRKTFIASIVVMCGLVLVRFFIIPASLSDPNNPLRMDHHEYWTMVSHFAPSMIFMFGAFFQKESVQKVAQNPRFLKYHRIIGRITVACSMISSIAAWRVSLNALHGTWMVYIPWNAFWNVASFKTFWYAWKKDFSRHRLWANVLVHTAFLFVTSRLFIVFGAITGAPMKLVYVAAVYSAAFLAFFWYLEENGQWARTVATRRRWAKLRAFLRAYMSFAKKGRNTYEMFLSSYTRNKDQKVLRICYGCNTEIVSNAMRCENARCSAFNDSAQGEYAQLFLDTNDELASMPFRTTIKRLSMGQKSEIWSQLASLVSVPFLVIHIWMALPLTYDSPDFGSIVSFDALVGWHMIYTYICVHMAASIFKCFPIHWKPLANPKTYLLSPVWNMLASQAAIVDAAFLYYCKANDIWISENPTWIVGLVVAFVTILLAPLFLSDRGMPRRFIRCLHLTSAIVLPLMGYVGSTIASYTAKHYITAAEGHSGQIILGIMVVLQLYEEILCQFSKGMIDAAKREFGLDEASLPPAKRNKEQQMASDNLESLFVYQDLFFGAYFFCFFRELWIYLDSTFVCLFVQAILLLQDFNMIFGGTVLRCVRVLVEGPIINKSQRDPREEITSIVPTDRRPSSMQDEIFIRLSRSELTESFRALSMKLLIRLISIAATPLFGLVCRFGPNSVAFPSWSEMSDAHFLTVLKNLGLMMLFESFFVAAIVTSLYRFFRINLLRLLASTLLRSPLTRVLFVCSIVHLLQDLYVAIISLPKEWCSAVDSWQ